MHFSDDFVFGASTCAYQIEGAVNQGGRGKCVWDMYSHTPGKTWKGHHGDIACDHYNRLEEDIALMKKIGLQGYRFSISWPRVIPSGIGTVNPEGIDFYDRLIDGLLASNIEPYLTLFHWDFPYELYKKGGWLNPDVSDWFADYTRVLVDQFSDRVKWWMTLNEPQVFIENGHHVGNHAPGMTYDTRELFQCAHNVLLAHGKATATIRKHAKQAVKIGPVPQSLSFYPKDPSNPLDIDAAYKRMFSMPDITGYTTTWWLDPIIKKQYPEDGLKLLGKDAPKYRSNDMDIIAEPVDFIGHNHYWGFRVSADRETEYTIHKDWTDLPLTSFEWPVTPPSIYWSTKWLYETYQKPIMITENGMSDINWVAQDGGVHDPNRIDYLSRYIGAIKRAVEEDIPVLGYMQWSLMDNYEWSAGYKERFGLIHVDYKTLKRTLKDSAYWYASIIKDRGAKIPSLEF